VDFVYKISILRRLHQIKQEVVARIFDIDTEYSGTNQCCSLCVLSVSDTTKRLSRLIEMTRKPLAAS